jgi:hypothetical protein
VSGTRKCCAKPRCCSYLAWVLQVAGTPETCAVLDSEEHRSASTPTRDPIMRGASSVTNSLLAKERSETIPPAASRGMTSRSRAGIVPETEHRLNEIVRDLSLSHHWDNRHGEPRPWKSIGVLVNRDAEGTPGEERDGWDWMPNCAVPRSPA